MAATVFPSVSGSNDLGGEVVVSTSNLVSTSPFYVTKAIPAGEYVATVTGSAGSVVSILDYRADGSTTPLTTVSVTTGGEGFAVFAISSTTNKILISNLSGSLTISKYKTQKSVVSLRQAMPNGLTPLFSPSGDFGIQKNLRLATEENDTHWFIGANANSNSSRYMAINKTTKIRQGLGYRTSAGGTVVPCDANIQSIGVKNGLIITSGVMVGQSDTQIARFFYDQATDRWICDTFNSNNLKTIFSSPGQVSVQYIPSINRFVAINGGTTVMYYSDDDGITWTAGGSKIVAGNYHMKKDRNSDTLFIRDGITNSINSMEYVTNVTQNATSWSFPVSSAAFFYPVFNPTGNFWTLVNGNANSVVYTATTLGGSFTSRTMEVYGDCGEPVVAGGRTIVPSANNLAATSGNVWTYSTNGTTWTNVLSNAKTNHGFAMSNGSNLHAIFEGNFVKWWGFQCNAFCYDIAAQDMWMSGPTFPTISNGFAISHDGTKFAAWNSGQNYYALSTDGHRWIGNLGWFSNMPYYKWFNGRFWGMNASTGGQAVTYTPQANGTFAVATVAGACPNGGAQQLIISGNNHAFSSSTSTVGGNQSRFTRDGGTTWNTITNIGVNDLFAGGESSPTFYWRNSSNAWYFTDAAGTSSTVTNDTDNAAYTQSGIQGIPYKGGAFLWGLSSNTLQVHYFRNGKRIVANSSTAISLGTLFNTANSLSNAFVWEFAGALYLNVTETPSQNYSHRTAVSFDDGKSWTAINDVQNFRNYRIDYWIGSFTQSGYNNIADNVLGKKIFAHFFYDQAQDRVPVTTHGLYELTAQIVES